MASETGFLEKSLGEGEVFSSKNPVSLDWVRKSCVNC